MLFCDVKITAIAFLQKKRKKEGVKHVYTLSRQSWALWNGKNMVKFS